MKKPLWKSLFFSAVSLLFFLPPIDTDLGWHLRYGKYFFQNWQFLKTNQLSVLLPNYLWPNSYGFYQILVFLIYRVLGLVGLSLINSLLFSLIFFFIYQVFKKDIYKTTLTLLLIVLPSWGILHLGLRAQLFSLLGIISCFWVFQNWSKRWFYLPLIFFLWVNFHGAFVLGIGLTLVFVLLNFRQPKILFQSLLASLATLINPYGLQVYQEAWRHLAVVKMDQLIAEWVPPQPFYLSLAVIFFIFNLVLFCKRKRKTDDWLLLITNIGFLYLTLKARRNLPFFFLTSSLWLFNQPAWQKLKANLSFQALNQALIILILAFSLLIQLPKTLKTSLSWPAYCQNNFTAYPCQAIDYFKNQGLKGNIFNFYRWGGFLSWQLPDSRVFVDGRMPAWPHPSNKSPYTIFLELLQARPGWEQKMAEYNIDYLLIPPGTFLDLEIEKKGVYSWQEIYRDKTAVIYEKKNNI